MERIIVKDLKEVAQHSLELLTKTQAKNVAVSGGSTYKALFTYWGQANLPEMDFYPVDERMVGFEEDGNNWKVAYDLLFTPAGITEQKSHMAVNKIQFLELLHQKVGQSVVLDQVWLGMGDDGHTASLFPGGSELLDTDSQVLETTSPKAPFPRVTLGLRPIWEAKELFLIVLGRGKAEMLKRALDGDKSLPITLALQGHPNPTLILDEEAASTLS
jgi:6-phosphogluconolactonase